MSENKGSTISVRLNAEELIGMIAVGEVIVGNTSLDGVANVVISTIPLQASLPYTTVFKNSPGVVLLSRTM